MKKLFILLFIPFFFLCLINYSSVIEISRNIWSSFLIKIIPTLLPMLLLTNIFIKGGFFINIIRKFPKFRDVIIIFISILLGNPSSLIFLNDLKSQNIITYKEKEVFFSSFGGISFPFLYSLIITFDSLKGIYFLLIYYTGEFLIYFFIKNKTEVKIMNIKKITINRNILFDSILASFKTLSIIICFSLLINFIFCMNLNVFNTLPLLTCFIEFSYSSFISLQNQNFITSLFMMMILSFTSLSLYFQVYYIDPCCIIENLIKKRWLISAINTCLFFIFFF